MISISIMAHPDRADYIPYIHDKLGYECPVAWEQGLGRRDTGRRAWMLHHPAASHHLVLQDDVILTRDLPEVLEQIVEVVRDQPISLFANDKKPWDTLIDQCRERPFAVRWLLLSALNWGPAVLLPVADIAPMLAWTQQHCFMPNYDAAIAYYYLAAVKRPVWYTMPSLVDHRTAGDSLVWPLASQKGRQARYFIGPQGGGQNLNWQGEVVCEAKASAYLKKHMIINETWRLKANGAAAWDVVENPPEVAKI